MLCCSIQITPATQFVQSRYDVYTRFWRRWVANWQASLADLGLQALPGSIARERNRPKWRIITTWDSSRQH
jgi:hypothetical protein